MSEETKLIDLDIARCTPRLQSHKIDEFLALKIPERRNILTPIIQEQGLGMVYAPRGVGKTYVALGIAYAVASGSDFLKWSATEPCPALYIDGEMPAKVMQERLAGLVKASDKTPESDHFRLITPDLQNMSIPDLSTPAGQKTLEPHLKGVKLLILDNLSTLCRNGRENEADSWIPIQAWLLELRRRGLSVLIVHHAGKGGAQRGTSKREDVLDTVISLKRPEDYMADEGARFEVHIEKARGLAGDAVKPFEAKLEVRDNTPSWTVREIENVREDRIRELAEEGLSVRDIAEETGIPRSTVSRIQRNLGIGRAGK
ncbi:MAG: AAA family ATPase [Fimbriimonadaceae bacterium]|nr:AAA family ATPase [Alphaproteobacteria bacterium]